MARKAVTPATLKVDRNFYIPDGLESVEYDSNDPTDDSAAEAVVGSSEGGEAGGEGAGVLVPDRLKIISQTLRTNKGGEMVVDVVVEVPDVKGVIKYDLRVTKTKAEDT